MAKRIREKAAKNNAERDRRPQATAKYLRISPSKVRIVLDLIRGQSYFDALGILKSTPKGASELIIKVLESAGANAENNLNMSKDDLYVAECFANEGQTLKRYWYRSHGSADMLKKRTSHITVILDEKKSEEVAPKKVEKPVKPAKTEKTVKVEKTEKPKQNKQKAQTQEGGK